jgi:DNA repair photolyase
MSLIYEPRGKAREYSPLALNIYKNCDHQCKYCYVHNFQSDFSKFVQPRNLSSLGGEAMRADRQILLCFTGDPYCTTNTAQKQTRKALEVLKYNRCTVAILTKGGMRSLEDNDLLQSWPDGRIKLGATLTFVSADKSREWEPGASLPEDRLCALEQAHLLGIKTWASIEPVLDPAESLAVIRESLPFVGQYKVGKLNHVANSTDWKKFCIDAVNILRKAGKQFYVKHDLRAFAPAGFLTTAEADMETVFLPDRPTFIPAQVEAQIMFSGM